MRLCTTSSGASLQGTHFDNRAKVTKVSVFDARSLVDGPLAVASLLYWLPLGFMGIFRRGEESQTSRCALYLANAKEGQS